MGGGGSPVGQQMQGPELCKGFTYFLGLCRTDLRGDVDKDLLAFLCAILPTNNRGMRGCRLPPAVADVRMTAVHLLGIATSDSPVRMSMLVSVWIQSAGLLLLQSQGECMHAGRRRRMHPWVRLPRATGGSLGGQFTSRISSLA